MTQRDLQALEALAAKYRAEAEDPEEHFTRQCFAHERAAAVEEAINTLVAISIRASARGE